MSNYSSLEQILKIHVENYTPELKDSLIMYVTRYLNRFYINFNTIYKEAKFEFEGNYIQQHLLLNEGRVDIVTKKTGIQIDTLTRKIRQHLINPNIYRPAKPEYRPDIIDKTEQFIIHQSIWKWIRRQDDTRLLHNWPYISIALYKDMKKGDFIVRYKEAMDYFNRKYLKKNLERYRTHKETAKAINISLSSLDKLIQRYGLHKRART